MLSKNPTGKLQHLQGAPQINVQARFLGFSIQGSGNVQDGGCCPHQSGVLAFGQPEVRQGDVTQENLNLRIEPMLEAGKIQVQLQCAPELEFSRPPILGSDQEIESLVVTLQQAAGYMRTKITCRSCDECRHGAGWVQGDPTDSPQPLSNPREVSLC